MAEAEQSDGRPIPVWHREGDSWVGPAVPAAAPVWQPPEARWTTGAPDWFRRAGAWATPPSVPAHVDGSGADPLVRPGITAGSGWSKARIMVAAGAAAVVVAMAGGAVAWAGSAGAGQSGQTGPGGFGRGQFGRGQFGPGQFGPGQFAGAPLGRVGVWQNGTQVGGQLGTNRGTGSRAGTAG
jgi:hypothetical protein